MFKNKLLFVIINFIKIELNQNILNTVKPPQYRVSQGKTKLHSIQGAVLHSPKKNGRKNGSMVFKGT